MLIRSGLTGVASQNYTFTSTPETFEYDFPEDLAALLTLFKALLGVKKIYSKVVPAPSDPSFIMLEFAGGNADADSPTRDVTFNLFCERPIGDQETYKPAGQIAYTVARLQWLLADNGNFQGAGGIHKLKSIAVISGFQYSSPVNTEGDEQFADGALIAVTYEIINSLLHSDR